MPPGGQAAELETLADVGRDVRHDQRAKTRPLPIDGRAHGFHIAGPERPAIDMELTLDDGGVGNDLAVDVQDEMEAADSVIPVVLVEPLVLVRAERRNEQIADRRDLRRGQILRRQPAQARPIGFRPTSRARRFLPCAPGPAR
jgi:predicted acylesterase/phospholipase RssA